MVNFFITRPIFAGVVAIVMVLAGIVGYVLLPIAQFPEIAPPQVVVTTAYPGTSAQTVADTVSTPLEQQINGVQGMAYMSSTSANDGTSTITIAFNVGYDVDIAAVDVQNRVSQATGQLPAIVVQAGITIQKKQPSFTLMVNLVSPDKSVDAIGLSNYAYLQLEPPRVCRRLQLLRRWSHDNFDDKQVLFRGPRARGADGAGTRRRACLALGSHDLDCREDWLLAAHAA